MANPFSDSIFVRLLVIGLLSLLLTVGVFMAMALVSERQDRRNETKQEVTAGWGGSQTLCGPALSVPFTVLEVNPEKGGPLIPVRHLAHLLPERLDVHGRIEPELRYVGIYQFVLYRSKLQVEGEFTLPADMTPGFAPQEVLWRDAYLTLGIADPRGIRNAIAVQWDDAKVEAEPGVRDQAMGGAGVTAAVAVAETARKYRFSFPLDLNGAEQLLFCPVGKITSTHLTSPWTSPSFKHDFLPEERRVDDAGFEATWRVLHINRNTPQHWTDNQRSNPPSHGGEDSRNQRGNLPSHSGEDFPRYGVSLIQTVDQYQQTMRALKYALLFILTTFLAYFIIEVRQARRIHAVQYLMIGAALLIFYCMLFAISEHYPFWLAFLAAASAATAQIGLYTRAALGRAALALAVVGLLAVLYSLLFVTLMLESYAVLVGAGELFLLLTIMMYLTRKVDWFNVARPGGGGGGGGGGDPPP
jgi:inner membrane protein